jgi:predicted RNase H-like HicB family nuclease
MRLKDGRRIAAGHVQQYDEAGRLEVMTNKLTFTVFVENGERNISAYVPEFPGCVTTSGTVEETLASMRETISLHSWVMAEDRRLLLTS